MPELRTTKRFGGTRTAKGTRKKRDTTLTAKRRTKEVLEFQEHMQDVLYSYRNAWNAHLGLPEDDADDDEPPHKVDDWLDGTLHYIEQLRKIVEITRREMKRDLIGY